MASRNKRKGISTTSLSAAPIDPNLPVQDQVVQAIDAQVECNVDFTCYRGSARGIERTVFVLNDGKNIVTIKGAYKGKAARAEIVPMITEDDLKKVVTGAAFSMKRSGYERHQIETTKGAYTNAFDLWESAFKEFENDLGAKAKFLKLIGAQDQNAFKKFQAKALKIDEDTKTQEAAVRYADMPGYGAF
jgi:hypothetical protein